MLVKFALRSFTENGIRQVDDDLVRIAYALLGVINWSAQVEDETMLLG
jgi:hypothetical protein